MYFCPENYWKYCDHCYGTMMGYAAGVHATHGYSNL